MPYNINSSLPKVIKALPVPAQSLYRTAFNKSYENNGSDSIASKVAWTVVKKRLKKQGTKWVGRAGAFESTQFYTFNTEKDGELVQRTDGAVVQRYVLSDTLPDNFGTSATEELLQEWAGWINKEQPSIDTDHTLWESAIKEYRGDSKLVARAMKAKQGIARAISAVFEKGRLFVNVLFDKVIDNKVIKKIRGLSIEAGVTTDELTKKWIKGDLMGFTFAVNRSPSNQRAVQV